MYRITVRDHMMVAHSLPHPAFGPAQRLHGATFVVELAFARRELGDAGVVMDIGEATGVLREVLGELDYRNLDEHPELAGTLTTTEALARFVAEKVAARVDTGPFAGIEVTLREHPDAWATYSLEP